MIRVSCSEANGEFTVVLIEFSARTPFSVSALDDCGRFITFDVERSRKYGGLWAICSSTDGELSLEHSGDWPYWVAEGFSVSNDSHQGQNRKKRAPTGRFAPDRIMHTLLDGEGGCLVETGRWGYGAEDFMPSEEYLTFAEIYR